MKANSRLFRYAIIFGLLFLFGCSESPEISDISMRLHDKYKTHFLHAEIKKQHNLFLIFRIDSTNMNSYQLQAKAHNIAVFAYSKVDSAQKIENITVRFQHIGAPTVIRDPNAHIYTFQSLSLK